MTEKVRKVSVDAHFVAPEEEPTFQEWLTAKLSNIFVNNIPLESIKDLPTNYMYIFGALAYILSLTCFLWFINTGYKEMMEKAYMSLDNPDDSICVEKAKTVDASYYADFTGRWNGEDGFQYSNSLYQLNLNKFKQTVKQYRSMMKYVGKELDDLGARAFNYDLAENMVYWMAWEVLLPNADSVNTFHMTGTPDVIFDREHVFGLYASQKGECLTSRETTFDKANAIFRLEYDVTEFAMDPICNSTLIPQQMGYDPMYDFDKFIVDIDVRTFIIAFAINNHVLAFDQLEEITGTRILQDLPNNLTIYTSKMFYNRYPGHSPLECITTEKSHVCGVRLGETFAMPTFNHFGTDAGFPQSCNCSLGFGLVDYCNVFDFMVGLVFYDIPESIEFKNTSANLFASLELALKYDDPTEMNRLAYNASYAAAMFDEYTDPAWRANAYDFCHSDTFGMSCSLMFFNTYDDISVTATEFYYQVKEGACNDSFTVGNWEKIQTNPPTELEQDYHECNVKWYVAIFSSTGIAAGNAATFVPFVMLSILPLVYLYLSTSGKLPPKDEYSPLELEAASKALALTILRIRDGKVRDIKADGVLKKFVKELMQSAKAEGGYPDSDDDSDDDEDAKGRRKSVSHGPPKATHRSAIFIKDSERRQQVEEPKPIPTPSPIWNLFGAVEEPPPPPKSIPKAQARKSAIKSGDLVILNDVDVAKRASFGRRPSMIQTVDGALDVVRDIKLIMQKAWDVKSLDGGGAVFRTAQNRTANLKLIDLRRLVAEQKEDAVALLFDEMCNLVVMHGSLAFGLELVEVRERYVDGIAYEVGGRMSRVYDRSGIRSCEGDVYALVEFKVGDKAIVAFAATCFELF